MLALIAGQGDLPRAVLEAHDGPVLICALEHCPPDNLSVDRWFRLETLGRLLRWLASRGVTEVCFCGRISRPRLALHRIDLWTWPLVPRVRKALKRGDDGALRIAMSIFEDAGFRMLAAHEAAPDLLPAPGVWGQLPDGLENVAMLGDRVSAQQGANDLGQACVLRGGEVLAREDDGGTDAMLEGVHGAEGGILYKAPKPGQDRRADLPVIGPTTVEAASRAGIRGIIIESQGVMVLSQRIVETRLQETGLFLWIRERAT